MFWLAIMTSHKPISLHPGLQSTLLGSTLQPRIVLSECVFQVELGGNKLCSSESGFAPHQELTS